MSNYVITDIRVIGNVFSIVSWKSLLGEFFDWIFGYLFVEIDWIWLHGDEHFTSSTNLNLILPLYCFICFVSSRCIQKVLWCTLLHLVDFLILRNCWIIQFYKIPVNVVYLVKTILECKEKQKIKRCKDNVKFLLIIWKLMLW